MLAKLGTDSGRLRRFCTIGLVRGLSKANCLDEHVATPRSDSLVLRDFDHDLAVAIPWQGRVCGAIRSQRRCRARNYG